MFMAYPGTFGLKEHCMKTGKQSAIISQQELLIGDFSITSIFDVLM